VAIKLQSGKVVLKNGKPSCECCGDPSIGCAIGSCPNGVVIPYETALALKTGGGTLNWELDLKLTGQYETIFQRFVTDVAANLSGQALLSAGCVFNQSIQRSIPDSGYLLNLLNPAAVPVPAANANVDLRISISLSETATSPRQYCASIGISSPIFFWIAAAYHRFGIENDLSTQIPNSLSVDFLGQRVTTSSEHVRPVTFGGLFIYNVMNRDAFFRLRVTFSPAAP